uniref:Purple acid phosphatase n=1 Tax=Parastrongyloides trichosuri TaxID=131310 RepID=A0A0N4Z3J1_PARTI
MEENLPHSLHDSIKEIRRKHNLHDESSDESSHQKTLCIATLIVVIIFVTLCAMGYFLFEIAKKIKISNKHQHIHLSLTKNPQEMVITWTTYYDYHEFGYEPNVIYGKDRENIKDTVYGKSNIFKDAKRKFILFVHIVKLTNLDYNTTYYYQVGDSDTYSQIFHFSTFPSSNNYDVKFCVIGNMDSTGMHILNSTYYAIKSKECQLIIHVGDFSYKTLNEKELHGDNLMHKIQYLSAYVPYMIIPGHEDIEDDDFLFYNKIFYMPYDNQRISDIDHFYSFNIGFITFIGLSSEVYEYSSSYGCQPIIRQIRWLENELKEALFNRRERPWIISYFHRPIYCLFKSGKERCIDGENVLLRKGYKNIPGFENYFHNYNVDLIFYGHAHAYQRNYPIYNRTVYRYGDNIYYNPPAPTYILSGIGNCDDCSIDTYYKRIENSSPFEAKRSFEVGYTQVHVMNHTHIFIKYINTKFNKIEDSFWIVKDSYVNHSYSLTKEYIPFNDNLTIFEEMKKLYCKEPLYKRDR